MAFPLSDAEHEGIRTLIDGQVELVVGAAIRVDGLIVSVERPGRHGDCINFLHRLGKDYGEQGFVTNLGRFVSREQAAQIVLKAGQGEPREGFRALFSEDMWNDRSALPDPTP